MDDRLSLKRSYRPNPDMKGYVSCTDLGILELVSECRELTGTTLMITVRTRRVNDETCLLPRSKSLSLEVPLAPMHVQNLEFHGKHG